MAKNSFSWTQALAWRLGQQQLAARAPHNDMLAVASRICGLHAQVLSAAGLALWARVEGVTPEDVTTALWTERTLVKLWAMRGTLHLLTASDVPLYVAAARETRRGYTRPSWQKYHGVTAAQVTAIIEAAHTILSDQPMTRAQFADKIIEQLGEDVGAALRSGWGAALKPASTHGYLCFGPSQGQNITFVQPHRWLGQWRGVEAEDAIAEVVRRYLNVYGPATPADFARWWGVEAAMGKKMFRQVSDELAEVEIEGGRGWMLTEDLAAMQQANIATNVRLLPNFDPYIVATNRGGSAVVPQAHRSRIYRIAGWISPVLLVNGVVEGVWQYTQQRSKISVRIESFAELSSEVEALVMAEAERLGQYLGGKVELDYGKVSEQVSIADEQEDDGA